VLESVSRTPSFAYFFSPPTAKASCLCWSKTKFVATIPARYCLELRATSAQQAGVQQLEDELGLVLFERGSRPVRLTNAGRAKYDQAVQMLERVETIWIEGRVGGLTIRSL
jgi:hypothetical protein